MVKRAGIVSTMILIVLLLAGTDAASVMLDRVVAIVNQDVIVWSELYREMEGSAPPQVREMKQEEKAQFFKANEAVFLEGLIDERLQLQEAKALNINVDSDDAKEAVENIKKKYSITDEQLADSLKKEGTTMDEYKKRLTDQITISRLVNRQIRSKILLSEDDVAKFLRENRDMINTADSYRISQIFFRMPKNETARKSLVEKGQAVYARAVGGEDFKALAKEFSEDPSADSGGDLGFIKKADLLREFGEALSRMKTGDVSKPFWTERGLHLIRLDEKTEIKDEAVLREEARQILYTKLFTERYKAWLKGLREKSFIEVRL